MPRRLLPCAVLLFAALSATASAAPKLPPGVDLPKIPKLTAWQGTIDLAGYSTATTTYDSTSECAPGEAWGGKQEASFETGRPMPIRINIVGRAVASEPVVTPGDGVTITTVISGYRTTKNCDRPTEESSYMRPADHCPAKISSKIVLGIARAPNLKNVVADDLDELEPLSQQAGLLLNRFSGPWPSSDDCPGFSNFAPRSGDAKAGTMAFTGSSGIDLPLNGIGSMELRNMKVGSRLKSSVRAGGACDSFLVNPAPLAVPAAYVEDCTLKTHIVVTLKRTG